MKLHAYKKTCKLEHLLEKKRIIETRLTNDLLDNPKDEKIRRFLNGLF